jgi:hypothetical protein
MTVERRERLLSIRELLGRSEVLCVAQLKRRSVQSYIGINFFLLEKSRFYGAANSTFLGGSVRVK